MKIINNKIYIVQGETPTYTASVIDKDTGIPYMILKTDMFPVVEFIVRPSIYNRADDFVYLSAGIGDEFLHSFRFGKSLYADPYYCTDGADFWYFYPVMCHGLCLWRWFFQCGLSYQSGAVDQSGTGRCQLQRLVPL